MGNSPHQNLAPNGIFWDHERNPQLDAIILPKFFCDGLLPKKNERQMRVSRNGGSHKWMVSNAKSTKQKNTFMICWGSPLSGNHQMQPQIFFMLFTHFLSMTLYWRSDKAGFGKCLILENLNITFIWTSVSVVSVGSSKILYIRNSWVMWKIRAFTNPCCSLQKHQAATENPATVAATLAARRVSTCRDGPMDGSTVAGLHRPQIMGVWCLYGFVL